MYNTKDYNNKCFEIFQKGGMLWLVERTDTHEYLGHSLEMWNSNEPTTEHYPWYTGISFMTRFFFTREDAETEMKYICPTMAIIPMVVSEHTFA